MDACHRTNDGQEHKIIWRAGPEQDFLLTCHSVQRARQPLSRRAISLGSFTGAVDFVLQLIRLESLGSELQQSYITTFILRLITLAMHCICGKIWAITILIRVRGKVRGWVQFCTCLMGNTLH